MISKLSRVIFYVVAIFLLAFSVFASQAHAQANTDGSAELQIDDSEVEFDCSSCSVLVEDTQISGTIWGESLGWVNLQPADGGVENTREGEVSGAAWGATAGWIDFSGVSIDPTNGNFSGTANSQNRGEIVFECPGSSCVNTDWRPEGCTDPTAVNFDNTATADDGSCEYEGCTDPEASNFSEIATIDDGTCTYGSGGGTSGGGTLGCTDSEANNYNPSATIDDQSCEYENPVLGCLDPEASNFNEEANTDDGSCEYENPILGCTNPEALNFNEDANTDDGSCDFFEINILGCMDPAAQNYDPQATIPSNGDCDYGGDGCVDPDAFNYDPEATLNDGSCEYEGCTNPEALNYTINATEDDGSCLFGTADEPGCTDPEAINYNSNAIEDNSTCIYDDIPQDDGGSNQDETTDPDPGTLEDEDVESNTPVDNQEDTEDTLNNVVETITTIAGNTLPESLNSVISNTSSFVIDNSGLLRLLGLALFVASILQIIPVREGAYLLSLFGIYKTKRYWGTVYDSQTKQPLDPAYVTLFDDAGQAVDTSITDIDGRYNFIVGPGTYYLSAQKTDYLFPSKKLQGKSYDELYTHLYFGGPISVKSQDQVLSLNIPMDPLNFNWNEYAKRKTKVTHFYRPWHRILSFVAHVCFVAGLIISVWVFVAAPTILSFIILSLYVLTIVLRLIGFRHLPRGYVQDSQGYALSYGIVRVYSAELRREVKHAVVAEGGHYLILVPNGRYYMIVEQKTPQGEYQEVYRTKEFKVRQGFIAKKIKIKDLVLPGKETQEKLDPNYTLQNQNLNNHKKPD